MGWRGQQNREDDEDARWGNLPLCERYDWKALIILFAIVGVAIFLNLIFRL